MKKAIIILFFVLLSIAVFSQSGRIMRFDTLTGDTSFIREVPKNTPWQIDFAIKMNTDTVKILVQQSVTRDNWKNVYFSDDGNQVDTVVLTSAERTLSFIDQSGIPAKYRKITIFVTDSARIEDLWLEY